MARLPDREEVAAVRAQWPRGTRVRLVSTSDPYTQLLPGALGTTTLVDDAGTIGVSWDSGSTLGMVPGEDVIAREPWDPDFERVNAGPPAEAR